MDQQEFVPESQEQRRQKQDGEQTSTYYQKTGNGPKEEHPSTFEDTVPPYVYRAQDSRHSSSQQAETRTNQRRANDSTSGRANRSYTGYQQQQQQQQQPRAYQRMRGTRPQYWWKPIVRWALLILLVIILIHILPFIIVLILSVLGVLAVALLLPIFILLGLVAAVVIIALIVLSMLGIPIRRRSRYFHR